MAIYLNINISIIYNYDISIINISELNINGRLPSHISATHEMKPRFCNIARVQNRIEMSTLQESLILCYLFFNFTQVLSAGIELKNFYPYGIDNGDTLVPTNDDGSSGRVDISSPFPFFDQNHNSLFVSMLAFIAI